MENNQKSVDYVKTEEDDIEEIIIKILEDHGYSGMDLLSKLAFIYKAYQQRRIKNWVIKDESVFIRLKDTIWYNFEHCQASNVEEGREDFLSIENMVNHIDKAKSKSVKRIENNRVGLSTLVTFGTKFPYLVYLFDHSSIFPSVYLPALLQEIDMVISLWKKTDNLYLADLYMDEGLSTSDITPIIIHFSGEHPRKYCPDCVERSTLITDSNGEHKKIPKKLYAYCALSGPINEFEQSTVYFNLLVDLRNAVSSAIQYHKDLRLVINHE